MSKVYSSREVIRILKNDGWEEVRVTGSHHHFKHPKKIGVVRVPHLKLELGKGLLNSIWKQAKLKGDRL
jgi:predicted RNA binding protein YcfA (HicA-like mRNA interferase family)